MGEITTGLKFYYRLPPFRVHTLLIHSDVLVFHEITSGPFRIEDTIMAPWSPEETEEDKVSHYMDKLKDFITN